MSKFTLDARLAGDAFPLGELHGIPVLLMNNALVPWLILVPRTEAVEFIDLDDALQQSALKSINILGEFVRTTFDIEKLNIATIGNIVSQMHIHIVGRRSDDYCWPRVVWGAQGREAWPDGEADRVAAALANYAAGDFVSDRRRKL